MNGDSVESHFPAFIETELFKFYFSSLKDIDRNISNVNIYVPNGNHNKMITSITYTLQFISKGEVVEQISIICKYSIINDNILIKFVKHLSSNNMTANQVKEVYEQKRIGFPRQPFLFSNNIKISFSRIEDNDYVIKITDLEKKENYIVHAGIIVFNNIKVDDRVDIEAIVSCVVKTNKDIPEEEIKKIKFTLFTPTFNRDTIITRLTSQYKIAICMDKLRNTIHFFDVGIIRLEFEDNKTNVYSLTSYPKTMMNSTILSHNDSNLLSYVFNEYKSIY